MKLAPGTIVERYVVEEEIGRGGIGRVYRVRHTTLNTLHALKIVQRDDERTLQRLLNEGRYQASVNHPGIVTVTDVLDISGTPGLVMEFIDGPSVYDLLRMTQLSVDQVSLLGSRILDAVANAHDVGLVHRDLKPGNILISTRKRDVFPKICDFGIAKALVTDDEEGNLTNTGHMMGTPAYMAPEQFLDAKNVDHRADLFALGIIFYEMLAQKRPFIAANPIDYYKKMSSGVYPRLTPSEQIPQRFINAIEFALMPDVEQRAPSARHLCLLWEGKATLDNVIDLETDAETPWDSHFFKRTATAEVAIPDSSLSTADPQQSVPSTNLKTSPGSPQPKVTENSSRTSAKIWVGLSLLALLAMTTGGLGATAIYSISNFTRTDTTIPENPTPAPIETVAPPIDIVPTPAPPPEINEVLPPSPKPRQVAPVTIPKPRAPEPPAVIENPIPVPVSVPVAEPVIPSQPEKTPTTGLVEIEGDASQVWLRNATGNYPAGQVPPGTYQVSVVFGTDKPVKAGTVEIEVGKTRILNCVEALRTCR